MRVLVLVYCLALVTGGCATPSEGDRRVNHQSKLAAQMILAALKKMAIAIGTLKIGAEEAKPLEEAAAEVAGAAADIEENSINLEKNLLGPPAKPEPYSPKASKEAREQSNQDHADGWLWTVVKTGVGVAVGWVGRGGLIRLLGLLFPAAMAGPLGAAVPILTTAIARVREQAQANGGQVQVGELLETIQKEAAANPAAAALIRELAHKAEARLNLKL